MKEKYSLIGVDGNAYSIMGYVLHNMTLEDKTEDEKTKYVEDAESGNYNHLLCVSEKMIEKLNKE